MPGTPFDNMPLEVRRHNFGWWGEPWWSYICYDEDGALLEEMRKPFPAGESCLSCGHVFEEGDSGKSMPAVTAEGTRIVNIHKECALRDVMGSVTCLRGEHDHESVGDRRADALAVWDMLSHAGSGSGSMSA